MSGIVLSSAVRQNLLALQDTAASLASTQNDLSTGKKVNSALDNPTNFFTAAGLDNRASDISNLLDGISNGVQVLQAANTGISSIESLVSQAKSIANQALQTSIGYSTKSNIVSSAITDASGNAVTASNLLGTGTVTAGATTGSAVTATTGSAPLTASTTLASLGILSSDYIGLGGYGVHFDGSSGQTTGAHLDLATATVGDLLSDAQANSSESLTYSISGGQITLNGTSFDISDPGGTPAEKLGLTTGFSLSTQTGSVVTAPGTASITGSSLLTSLTSPITTSDSLTVNGKVITFNSGAGTTTSSTGTSIDLTSETVNQLLATINSYSGGTSSIGTGGSAGKITLNSSTSSNLVIANTGGADTLLKLGLTGGSFAPVGNTLSFAAVGTGTATTVTFGTGTGQVKSLDDLNAQLSADNLSATLDSSGKLTISTTNDAASASIGTVGGTAFSSGSGAFNGKTASGPVADATSQAARSTLVSQYNAILSQIDNTASDSSYNGVNLLNGDQLQLTFNETGKSKLNITGVNFGSAGLGLASLTSTSFADNHATNSVLSTLNTVSATLRSQASALGSNLSVVQTRQDFNSNLINVLQTGSANLTQADINLEAANSQALSTRQSLSVSALSLANQSQQSVLQLLR